MTEVINFDELEHDDETDTEDNFEDANEKPVTDEDVFESWQNGRNQLYRFFNEGPQEVIKELRALYKTSLYHALGYSAISFLFAISTLNKDEMETADDIVKNCTKVIQRYRHKNTLTNNLVTKLLIRPKYNSYTDAEVQAELCYADCLIMRGILIVFQDGNLMSYLKGGLKIRRSHQAYKECKDILDHRGTWNNASLKEEFESGVDIGLGVFNMIVAGLPSRLLKFLQFIGFSGDKVFGFKRLNSGQSRPNTIRGLLCTMTLLCYYELTSYLLSSPVGRSPKTFDTCDQLIESFSHKCPKGVTIQYFTGKLHYIRGNFLEAKQTLEEMTIGKLDAFLHLAFFELIWLYTTHREWRKVASCLDVLCNDNSWSKAWFYYMKACALNMCNDLNDEEHQHVLQCMKEVPNHVKRFIGRSFPFDKFCFRRAERFFAQDNWLPLPVYEIMYGMGYFYFLKGKKELLEPIMVQIERTIVDLTEGAHKESSWHVDGYCLALFLKGVCLSYLDLRLSAEECFLEVLENQKKVVRDYHVIAFALVELSYICRDAGNNKQALEYLYAAKQFSIFFTDFRIHEGLADLRRKGIQEEEEVEAGEDYAIGLNIAF